jgi:hypothetical protein
MDPALKAVHTKYIAEQVLWWDVAGDTERGPATVVEVKKIIQSLPGAVLVILDHHTGSYFTINPGRAQIVVFDDEEFDALPELTQKEIGYALEWGQQCAWSPNLELNHEDRGWHSWDRCTDSRMFGEELCETHINPNWPYDGT